MGRTSKYPYRERSGSLISTLALLSHYSSIATNCSLHHPPPARMYDEFVKHRNSTRDGRLH
jgi:hypothetical protein